MTTNCPFCKSEETFRNGNQCVQYDCNTRVFPESNLSTRRTPLCKTRAELNKANEEIRRLKEALSGCVSCIESFSENGSPLIRIDCNCQRKTCKTGREALAKAKEALG